MRKFFTLIKATLTGMIVFALIGNCLLAQKIEIKMEDGVPVVYNPKNPVPPPGVASQLILQKDLVLGGESEDLIYPFSLLSFLVVDDYENMIVLDNKEACIKIFDKSGNKIKEFGRRGQGPGEFQGPTTLTVIEGGKIGVIDPANHRFSYFSQDGECLEELSMEKYSRIMRVKADSQGFIYANFFTVIDAEKDVTYRVDLIKFDSDLNPLKTIGSFEQSRKRREVVMIEKRFGYALRGDDSLVWGVSDEYTMEIVDPDGIPVRRIVKDYEPIKVTEEDRQKMIKDTFGERELPPSITLNFPKNYPPFYYIICDDRGRIYVRTYEIDHKGGIFYDVFDNEGRYLTKFVLPLEEMIFVIKKDKAYTVNRTNIPCLTRYNMKWQ